MISVPQDSQSWLSCFCLYDAIATEAEAGEGAEFGKEWVDYCQFAEGEVK